jgi:hypothetical protein
MIGQPMTLKEPDEADSAIAEFFRDHAEPTPRRKLARMPRAAQPAAEDPDLFPSPPEQRSAQRWIERRQKPDAKPQVQFRREGDTLFPESAAHPDDAAAGRLAVLDTFATGYEHFGEAMARSLNTVASLVDAQTPEAKLSESLAIVQGLSPRSELETMLSIQMAAVHAGIIKSARHLASAPQHLLAEPALIMSKLARTFAVQTETLKNLRLNGRQEIHVFRHRADTGDGSKGPRANGSDVSDADLQLIATGRPPQGGGGFLEGHSHESKSLDGPIDLGSKVPREIKEIAAGLPRPRNARS